MPTMKNEYVSDAPPNPYRFTTKVTITDHNEEVCTCSRYWDNTQEAREYLQRHLDAGILIKYSAYDNRTGRKIISKLDSRPHTITV